MRNPFGQLLESFIALLKNMVSITTEYIPPKIRLPILLFEIGAIGYLILPQSLFHSFSCQLDKDNIRQNYQASNGSFIDNQVIVIGTEAAVRTVIGTSKQAGTADFILNPIEGCNLSYLYTRKTPNLEGVVRTQAQEQTQRPKVVMKLYEIPHDLDFNTVITKLQSEGLTVSPNYLISLSDTTPDACVRSGDPGSGGGHPYGGPGPILPNGYDPAGAQTLFQEQWAFRGAHGIDRLNLWITSTSSTRLTGDDVRIGVFDTSPFRNPLPFFKRIGIAFPSPFGYPTWDAGGATIMSNHGLFVAALIHSIAPKSSIQLIRVLNDSGCGEVWVLNKGLQDYMSRMSAWSGDLDDTVINMSLGIPNTVQNYDVATLQYTIDKANRLGAVIIAAAGNDSPVKDANGKVTAEHAPMEVPASYPDVYGVAATNPEGDISCYSNEGDITAPGGDGGKLDVPQLDGTVKTLTCQPRSPTWDQDPPPDDRTVKCDDAKDCPFGVISLVQTRYGPQYTIWSGTSFAAPLVSGLAALAYEKNTHDQVVCIIKKEQKKNASRPDRPEGWGSIDLNDNLSPSEINNCRNYYPSPED